MKMDLKISEENVIADKITQYTKCFIISNGRLHCQIDGCASSLSDKSAAIRHLKGVHPEITAAIDGQKKAGSVHDLIEVRTKINPSILWNAILQMIIFGSLPFTTVQSPGFRYLINPFVTTFNEAGVNFAVNPQNVQIQIKEKSEKIRKIISNEVKGNMICLLLDIASRFNRSIFGINITYWCNGKLCIRSIGMHTLKISQTGRNLFEIVKDKLSNVGISLEQIFSVTSDNGSNMLKMAKLLQNDLSPDRCGESTDYANDYDENDDEPEIDIDYYEDAYGNSNSSDETFDPEIFNEEYFHDLLSNLRNEFSSTYDSLFTGISCAAHGLHLVVKDAINQCKEIGDLIEKCRTLVKKLRTPNLRGELKKRGQKMPIIDVKTRWSSLYNMVG